MSDIFKFLVSGDTVQWFEQDDDNSFELKPLRLNQSIAFDALTSDVTIRSTFQDFVKVEVFHQTADLADDASLYGEPATSFTALDGTPLTGSDGGHGQQHGGKNDLDNDGNDNDHVTGGFGKDNVHGGFGDDHLDGGQGDDRLDGDAGDDDLLGGDGNDTLNGGVGFDALHGGNGADKVNGGDDADQLYGDDGADKLAGGNGDDVENGGLGNDKITGDAGNDTLNGDDGTDNVSGGIGDDHVSGGAGNDKVSGGDGSDTLSGDDGNDSLDGGAGADDLAGGLGTDTLKGGAGDDDLEGGAGADRLSGGLGADHFVFVDGDFAGLTAKTADRIVDFSHAQGDLIDLSGVDANTLVDGDQGFAFVGTAAFSHTAGELRIDASRGAVLVQGDTNGDGVADFAIRLDGKGLVPVEADFVL
ncbi:MAG: hypothetical protein IH997_00375 [Proteobacteria bacterium]|nr:hypothetical protein [Pseudomonadota bacterium]